MTYVRVLPRDLFNEANLLKCYGRLWLLTEGIPGVGFREETVAAFEIAQNDADGSIRVSNLTFGVRGAWVPLYRPLNSREPWPLYALPSPGKDDEIAVFNDAGGLSSEMLAFVHGYPL